MTNSAHRFLQFLLSLSLQLIGLVTAFPLSFNLPAWYWSLVTVPIGIFIWYFGLHWTNYRNGGMGIEEPKDIMPLSNEHKEE